MPIRKCYAPHQNGTCCETAKPRPDSPEPANITLKFLAEYLHFSPATVSLVINQSPAAKSIPDRTQEKVLRAAKKFDYRPNFLMHAT